MLSFRDNTIYWLQTNFKWSQIFISNKKLSFRLIRVQSIHILLLDVSLAPVRLLFGRKSEQINWVSGSTWPKQTTDRTLDHGRYRMLVYVAQAVSQKIITRYTSTLRFSLGFCYHACCSQYQRGNVLGWMPYSKGWQVASDKGQHFYLQTTKTTEAPVP